MAGQATQSTPLLSGTNGDPERVNVARRILYFSHSISEFSDQAWQFAVVMFLAAIRNYESLILVSGYGLTLGVAVVLWGSMAGTYFVDETNWNRLTAIQVLITCQNICIVLAALTCWSLLMEEKSQQLDNRILLMVLFTCGSAAQVLSKTITVVLERDWIVVMADNSQQQLSSMNVTMRRIDLTCRIVGPAVTGLLIGPVDMVVAVVLVGSLNILSLLVECACSIAIYRRVPALAHRGRIASTTTPSTTSIQPADTPPSTGNKLWLPRGLQIYSKQRPVAYAGMALSLLYLNSLTFGSLMTAYLLSRGMRLETVGIWRSISSATGLLGTLVYAPNVAVTIQGFWSLWYQLLCISASFFAILFLAEGSLAVLIGGVVMSRVGLWVFDISVTQLMQQHIPECYRGSVGGTQQALNSMFQLISFGLGLVWPDPHDFAWLVAAGYLGVVVAALLYTFGIFFQKEKLAEQCG